MLAEMLYAPKYTCRRKKSRGFILFAFNSGLRDRCRLREIVKVFRGGLPPRSAKELQGLKYLATGSLHQTMRAAHILESEVVQDMRECENVGVADRDIGSQRTIYAQL